MSPPLPVSVRVGHRPPGIVIDATFALSTMGLLVTMALTSTANVWLPRSLYSLLDNDAYYRLHPDEMGGKPWLQASDRCALLGAMALELEPWRQAWLNGRLSSRVNWIADARYESVLPDREESGLLPRFESCAAALDAGVKNADLAPLAGPLDDCARDAVALAAALQPETTYILTLGDPSGREPPLTRFIKSRLCRKEDAIRWAGLPGWVEAAFAPALAPLAACRATKAAIVQIAAPVILALPDAWTGAEWDNDGPPEATAEALGDLWRDAGVLWRPLAALEAAA